MSRKGSCACGSAGTGDGVDNDSDGKVDDGCPTVIYSYDDAGRLTSVVDAMGKTTSYGYDANGNKTSVTNAKRQPVGTAESGSACGSAGTGDGVDNDSDGVIDDGCPSSLTAFDNLNRPTSHKDALGNTWSGTYDAASRLSTRTDPKGQQTAFGYDNRGGLTLVDYPAGTTDVSFQYDGVRNRTQMADATGTTSYSYDALNRLTSVTFPGSRTVSYTYSNAGNRATMTYPGGSNQVSYGYDAASNLTSVTDWNSNQTSYAYDNGGQLTTITLPSGTGVVGTMTYDSGDRLTGVSWAKGGNTLASASYTLDAVGSRTQRVDQAGTHSYAYDALYRLTSVTYPGPTTDSYTYDAAGNRLTKNSTSFTYDAADRLTTAGSTSYTYDNNGNTTARGSDSFAWDPSVMLRTGAADRLTSATVAGTTTTFAYNGNGLRDSLTTGGNTTTFTWDIAASMPQVIDDGALKYVYGLGRIAQVGSGGATFYYLADGLGSTMALCDNGGNVANAYNYDAFGSVRSSTGSQANDFKFTGEQADASTGLEYLRARYYDPAAGSFISRDSYGGSANQPLSQNRFAYAEGNPILNTDPSGMCIPASTYQKIRALRNPFRDSTAALFERLRAQALGSIAKFSCDGSNKSVYGNSSNAATPTATSTPPPTGTPTPGPKPGPAPVTGPRSSDLQNAAAGATLIAAGLGLEAVAFGLGLPATGAALAACAVTLIACVDVPIVALGTLVGPAVAGTGAIWCGFTILLNGKEHACRP